MLRTLLIVLLLTPFGLRSEDIYRVHFASKLEQVSVEACFDGAAPRRLYRHSDAGRYTTKFRWDEGDIKGSSRTRRVSLPKLPPNTCISWEMDLAKAAEKPDYRTTLLLDDSLVTSGDLWFWRDGERRSIRVEVSLPHGYSISAPWMELPSPSEKHVFQVVPTPASWSSRIAVGRFLVQRVPVGGTELRVTSVGKLSDQQRANLNSWIGASARSVSSVFGHFPRTEPQVLIIGVGEQGEAVPWAHVLRGGGIASEFFVDENRSLSEFNNDWTATHELSHMLLPYVSSNDRWLSEGLASYYQNVLRARDGRLTERQAWQKLHSGFQRGKAATKPARRGESLASATQSGRSATMRVYWSGAAMMLEADARLRSLSSGRQSLDSALAALYDCCFNAGKQWRAQELFSKLDQLTGFKVFSDIYRQHVMSTAFPEMDQTYEKLGLVLVGNSIQVKPGAPWGRIRHFIMNDMHVVDLHSYNIGTR